MKPRMEYWKVAPGAFKAMSSLENYLRESGLDHRLLHMIKLRASQINGCAYCIDMHWKDARAAGESEQRLYGLGGWRESPYYSDRERAAFEWTEALTNINAPPRGPRPRRDLRRRPRPLLRKGTGRPHVGGRSHQRVESSLHRLALRTRQVQARGARE